MEENPYRSPTAVESKPAFQAARTGLVSQIVGLLLYILAVAPFYMSVNLFVAAGQFAMSKSRGIAIDLVLVAFGVVFGLLTVVMLWVGYQIRRPRVEEFRRPPSELGRYLAEGGRLSTSPRPLPHAGEVGRIRGRGEHHE